jgi:hypothetical protein
MTLLCPDFLDSFRSSSLIIQLRSVQMQGHHVGADVISELPLLLQRRLRHATRRCHNQHVDLALATQRTTVAKRQAVHIESLESHRGSVSTPRHAPARTVGLPLSSSILRRRRAPQLTR